MGLGELREYERQQETREREVREREHHLAREELQRKERELREQQQKEREAKEAKDHARNELLRKERELREQQQREREAVEAKELARAALLERERKLREQQQKEREATERLNAELELEKKKEEAISRANIIIQTISPIWNSIFGSDPRITSVYRSNSAAHRRGAVDISVRDSSGNIMDNDTILNTAKKISETLGSNYYVIAEIVSDHTQTNTTYHNGAKGNTRVTDRKATETHIHAQIIKDAVE